MVLFDYLIFVFVTINVYLVGLCWFVDFCVC